MKKYPKISIVIPLYLKTAQFYEAVDGCLELDYPSFEIIVVVDLGINIPLKHSKLKLIRTNKKQTGPAEKRDLALKEVKGDYIAFLDDDSYPDKDWLKNALRQLRKRRVNSVCGPGLTPPSNGLSQKLTGAILSSYFGSGPFYYRFTKGKPQYVDDYPAYNLIVSKKVLDKIGGFGSKFYGGEDTALCIKIINEGYKIYYHPEITVYHHRRAFPQGYFRQVGNVGMHRGYFVKAYPQTSLRSIYFMPMFTSIFVIMLLFFAFVNLNFFLVFLTISFLSYLLIFLDSLRKDQLHISIILPVAILLSHFVYGFHFMKGLTTKKLER